MREVILDQTVDTLFDALWNNGDETLVARLEDAIDRIAQGDHRARQHRVAAPPLREGFAWLCVVRDHGRSWVIVWSEVDDNLAKVHAISQTQAF